MISDRCMNREIETIRRDADVTWGAWWRAGGRLLRREATRPLTSFLKARKVARQRRELAALDDRMLRDIGVTRDHAERESRRPFWDY